MMFKRILVQYGVEKNTIKVFLFLLYCVFSSLLSLFIYMAVFYPTEFLLTEKLIVAERVSLIISSSFLLSIIAVIALTDWKKSVTPFFAGGLIFVLAGINFFGNSVHTNVFDVIPIESSGYFVLAVSFFSMGMIVFVGVRK